MALDPSFIGRSYPASPVYQVSRAKIREFAEAIGDDNLLYSDPAAAQAAGYSDVVTPPTFLTIINIAAINVVINDPDLGLDYSRMVHGDQRFDYHRQVHAGDELRVIVHIEDIMHRAGNDFINMRADIVDNDDEIVVVSHAQLVVRDAVKPEVTA
nr:MaoC family dehydratase N-terminal domain-containing protein [Kibdelosporangium sp. MJ126-NF4]CEL15103.1 COGs COG2030 [Kibdelosporangium sp. MJ126-NF4]CTQ93301.1 COGs COG2030 [Kibdelosporangium sp. MJ126-NF4]